MRFILLSTRFGLVDPEERTAAMGLSDIKGSSSCSGLPSSMP